jgi:uncharacterized protein YbgA (DUF1722 family)/uncharacterized protein YbbK (DUF523 family)
LIILEKFQKPKIVVSKCIEFESCRYNGLIIASPIVKTLKKYVDFQAICPEVEIQLGIPRDPIRIVEIDGEANLIQPSTGKNLTKKMNSFSDSFLNSLPDIDGFILKNRSPSCGIKAVKVYPYPANSMPQKKGVGLFAAKVFKEYPYLPIEDEGRLKNIILLENFLTAIYTLASYRAVKKSLDLHHLIEFHSHNKLLFMSYQPEITRRMGNLLANQKDYPLEDLFQKYHEMLLKNLHVPPEAPSNINMLMHALGYFSKKLSHEEKAFFLDAMEKYRQGVMPLLVCLNILKAWVIRFNDEYLAQQTFFQAYPEDLMPVTTLYR